MPSLDRLLLHVAAAVVERQLSPRDLQPRGLRVLRGAAKPPPARDRLRERLGPQVQRGLDLRGAPDEVAQQAVLVASVEIVDVELT